MPWTVPHQSYTTWKVCVTIVHCLAIFISAFRLWLRYRCSRMWWDDYLVGLPVLVDMLYWIVLWRRPPPGPTTDSLLVSTLDYWLSLFPSFSVIWFSRICFLLLLARLFPPRHVYRRITLALTVIFSLTYVTFIALSAPRCNGVRVVSTHSKLETKTCEMPANLNAIVAYSLTTGLLSDLILVIWPLLMLYKVRLSRPKDRPLVVVSLGCSIFTFLPILAIVIFTYGPVVQDNSNYLVVCMLEHITAAVSLTVCNMPVVACATYRLFQRARGVPLGTIVQMPAASRIPGRPGESGSATTLPPTCDSKTPSTRDTRLTYDDLTRISMSFDTDEA